MRAVQYLGILTLIVLMLPTSLAYDIGADGPAVRATQAMLLIRIAEAEGDSYAIDCGNGEVLNIASPLQTMGGYEPIVCVLDMGDKQAVTFTTAGDVIPDGVIEHFANYGKPEVTNVNIIKSGDLDDEACNDPEDLGEGEIFGHCDGFLDQKNDYKVYLYKTLYSDPTTYLVTIDFTPYFHDTWWDDILDFFQGLLGIGGETAPGGESIKAFERGYFAYAKDGSNERRVQAFFDAETMSDPGSASIIYQGFILDFSELAGEAEYMPGQDHTQVLTYDHITADTWHKITAALRLAALPGTPHASDVCNNNILGYGEECEPDGLGGFLGNAQTCQDLGMEYGTLLCGNDCQYDTSNCVSCANEDGDDYYTAEGVPSELRATNKLLLGSIAADTIYDNAMTGFSDDYDFRTELGLKAQAFPLTIKHFDTTEFTNTLASARDALFTDYETCLIDNTTNTCLAEALLAGNSNVELLGSIVAGQMLTDNNIVEEELCGWDWMLSCPGGAKASGFGFAATSYKNFFITLAEEGITPIFFLDNHPYRLANTNAAALESALSCAALAKGVRNTWAAIEGEEGTHYDEVEPNTYIHGHRSGLVNDTNVLDAYQACRAGIHAVHHARLYYYPKRLDGTGRVVIHTNYRDLADIILADPDRAFGLLDGLLVDMADPYGLSTKVIRASNRELISFLDFRKAMGAPIIVINNVTGPVDAGQKTVLAMRANAKALLFTGTRSPFFGEALAVDNELLPAGLLVKEIFETVAEKNTYAPTNIERPQSRLLIANDGTSTNVLSTQLTTGAPDVFPLDDCSGITIEEAQEDGTFAVIDEASSIEGLYRYSISDWACFLEDANIAVCSDTLQEFDCNDDDSSIYPGAVELCDDEIDNDCDGLIDLADDCELVGGVPPAVECDYDDICEPEVEDPYTCVDCYGYLPCPQPSDEWGSLGTIGHYDLSMRWDADGVPKLRIDPQDGCDFGEHPPADYKDFPYKISIINMKELESIYYDTAGADAFVTLEHHRYPTGFAGWKIFYNGAGDATAASCWGAPNPNYDGYLGEPINLFEFGHCSAHRCVSFQDCASGNLCLPVSEEYDYRTCVLNNLPGGGGLCFTPETPVQTPQGLQSIAELDVGDTVIGFDEESKQNRHTTIVDKFVHELDGLVLVINERISLTPEHVLFANGKWKQAGELVVGEMFLQDDGEEEMITSLEYAPYEGLVYNIHTEPLNNYYADGVLVHNMKPGDFENRIE